MRKAYAHASEFENDLEHSDHKKWIQAGLGHLSEKDSLLLTLFYLREMNLEEIGILMDAPSNTIKVAIHRARKRLATELTKLMGKEAEAFI